MGKYRIILLGSIVGFILLLVAGYFFMLPPEARPGFFPDLPELDGAPSGGVTLNFWSVYDDSDSYNSLKVTKLGKHLSLFDKFKKETGNTVQYRKFSSAKVYERTLLDQISSGAGPDIFSVHHTWLPRYQDKLAPLPKELIDQVEEYKKIFGELPHEFARKKEYYNPSLFVRTFSQTFAPVATQDFVRNGKIYAIPFYVDSLVLFYNQDIFARHSLVGPPKTWKEFQEYVKTITEIGPQGEIKTAGACLGTADNVNRAPDILAALMMQSGAQMVSEDKKRATFDENRTTPEGESFNPGARALQFYTDFANPQKKVYTWNAEQDYSIDAFAEGKCAMMINYSYQIPTIKKKNSRLDFSLAPLPQIEGSKTRIDYASYWAQGVNRLSEHPKEAWRFILFMAKKDNLFPYLWFAKRPTSREDLTTWQTENMSSLKAPILQLDTARSWYQPDVDAVDKIFNEIIRDVNLGTLTPLQAVHKAADKVNQILR